MNDWQCSALACHHPSFSQNPTMFDTRYLTRYWRLSALLAFPWELSASSMGRQVNKERSLGKYQLDGWVEIDIPIPIHVSKPSE